MSEQLAACEQCGQARPANGPCPYHEGPGACVTAPMQVQGRPAGPVRLEPAPHSLGWHGQADHLFRELCETREGARLAEKHAAQRDLAWDRVRATDADAANNVLRRPKGERQ